MFIKMKNTSGKYSKSTKPVDGSQPIPKDIFEKYLLHRISPSKIRGDFPRSQESWKALVESKYNGGKVIEKDIDHYDRSYKVDWEVVYNLLSQGESNVTWEKLFHIDIDDPEYVQLAIDMGAGNDIDFYDPFISSIYRGNVKIIEYLMKEYPDIYEYKDIYEAVNDYFNRSVLPSKWTEGFRKILNYEDKNNKRFDLEKFKIDYRWSKLLSDDFNIEVYNEYNLGNNGAIVYHIARDAKETVSKYKEDPINNHRHAKERLGELLDQSANKSLDPNLFEYLIDLGAPITSNKGRALAKAVDIWEAEQFIESVSPERFTNYMRDRTRARNFVLSITNRLSDLLEGHSEEDRDAESEYQSKQDEFIFIIYYLSRYDTRRNRKDSYAYNEFLEYFKDDWSSYNHIKRKLMND